MATAAATSLTQFIKSTAATLGFELVGMAPAVTPAGLHPFCDWLDQGYAGGMEYLPRRRDAYRHPQSILDGVRSIVMLAINYNPGNPSRPAAAPAATSPPSGQRPGQARARVARYAQGQRDYHTVLRRKLKQLGAAVRQQAPGIKLRGIVDTAPLLERDYARLAGLGWFGKNTMLINRRLGSWFFLAALLVDQELEYDELHATAHCGTCTRCLDACPTDAFVAPYVLDARRCISYLTIEHRGSIPEDLRPGLEDWLFGCDVCQEVCPWNRKAPVTRETEFQPDPERESVSPLEILALDEAAFTQRFGHTPLSRPGRAGLARNAAIVAGNAGDPQALPALTAALEDPDQVVRESAAWAIAAQQHQSVPNDPPPAAD